MKRTLYKVMLFRPLDVSQIQLPMHFNESSHQWWIVTDPNATRSREIHRTRLGMGFTFAYFLTNQKKIVDGLE